MPVDAPIATDHQASPIAASAAIAVSNSPALTPQADVGSNQSSSIDDHTVSVPFSDFVGRCFLRGCLWADMFASWIRVNQSQVPESVIAEEKRKFDWHTTGWLRSSVGAAACALVAGAVVAIFWSSSLRSLVPFFFLFVISFVALRFGQFAGLAGTICAALLFASILFEPRPSLAMSNPAERNHLICMVVIGICASELLGRRKHPTVYKPW